MGHFYTNFAVRHASPSQVADVLRSLGRSAFFSPVLDGTTLVYDAATEDQQESEITELGVKLSSELNCPVLACLNHDDDILAYWLFRAGAEIDQYNSWPGCFGDGGDEPSGGSAELLAKAFAVESAAEIHSALHEGDYAFAFERHMALAEALRINPNFVIYGHVDISRNGGDQTILKQLTAV